MPSTSTDRLNGLTTSVAIKPPCRVATTANITLYGEQTIDSVAVVEGDRVLVKDQTSAWQNGIYVAATGAWTRAKDFDGNRDVVQGTIVLVRPASSGTLFYEVQTANPIVIGTSNITFAAADPGVETLTNRLADTSSASNGDALVGTKRTESGALAETLHAWFQRREVDAEQFPSVQAALDTLAPIVNVTSPAVSWSTGVTLHSGQKLRFRGKANSTLTLTADITPFNFTNTNDASVEGVLVVVHAAQTQPIFKLTASLNTMARNAVNDVQVSSAGLDFPVFKLLASGADCGIWKNKFSSVSASGVGAVVDIETAALNAWTNSNTFDDFYVNDYIRGVKITTGGTAADGCSDSLFKDWGAQTSARTLVAGATIPNSTFGINRRNHFQDVRLYDLTGSAVAYSIGTGVDRTEISGATGDTFTGLRFTDNGVNTIIPGNAEYLTRLLARGRYLPVPTAAGWTQALIGSATTAQQSSYLQLRTGTTNPSTARAYTEAIGGMCSTSILSIDFGKKFVMGFGIARATSEAAAVGRFQLKQVQTSGALAAAGLGLQIDNLAVTGESYGSALGGVALGNLTDGRIAQVVIIHYPGVRTEWWIDGAYVAQQTDTTKIPSGTVACYLVTVLGNNSTSDVQLFVTQPWIWAEV